MNGLVATLKKQNAKERYWLLNAALDQPTLGTNYTMELTRATGWKVPRGAWWAMDYHLDWLACATTGNQKMGVVHEPPVPGWNFGTQEDVDLIVAWDDDETTKVILVEAKGVTSHSNKQVNSKLAKLTALFGQDGQKVPGVDPRFVLASPRQPSKLEAHGPVWAMNGDKLNWMPLHVPNNLVTPTRCENDGTIRKAGTNWKWRPRGGGSI